MAATDIVTIPGQTLPPIARAAELIRQMDAGEIGLYDLVATAAWMSSAAETLGELMPEQWPQEPTVCQCQIMIVQTIEETLGCPLDWNWQPEIGWIHPRTPEPVKVEASA